MIWTAAEVCEIFGINRRTLTNWLNEDPPIPSTLRGRAREFDPPTVIPWHGERAVRLARASIERELREASTSTRAELQRRREEAETKLAEMDVAEREGELVEVAHVDVVVGELCDRFRAALVNMPGNYSIRLEALGIDAAKAEAELTAIADDLTLLLRAGADELEALPDDTAAIADQ
jgi:phage terminase Nu1 subunit (DNA packaging protein)